MPHYSGNIPNSFYNRLFPKLFWHDRRMPRYKVERLHIHSVFKLLVTLYQTRLLQGRYFHMGFSLLKIIAKVIMRSITSSNL